MNTTHKINNWIENYPGIWEQRSLSEIKYIGVCHTASRLEGKSLEQICDDINSWHQNNAWPCISYHYVISENGEIAQTNSLDANSYTVGDKRRNTVCICLDGNFEIDKPTNEQLEALDWLLNELSHNHPEFPATQEDVYGDNELNLDTGNPTACPGKNLTPLVQEWRAIGKFSVLEYEPNIEVIDPKLESVEPIKAQIPAIIATPKNEPTTTPKVVIEEPKTTNDYGQLTKIVSALLLLIAPILFKYFGVNIDQDIATLTSFLTGVILLFTNPKIKK